MLAQPHPICVLGTGRWTTFSFKDVVWKLYASLSVASGQKLATRPHLAVKDARKCSLYRCLTPVEWVSMDVGGHHVIMDTKGYKIYIALSSKANQ